MTTDLLKILFVIFTIFFLYWLIFNNRKGLTLFELHFKDGHLTNHKGKIPEKFERDSRKLAKAEKLTCTIRAERQGCVRLHISANVSDDIAQRLRNNFPFDQYEQKRL